MDHRIPRIGAAISIVLALAGAITFLVLNARFEGPDPTRLVHHPFELTARFADSRAMATKQPVMHKGIVVGRVTAVDWDGARREAVVRFTLNKGVRVRRDAVARIGDLSLLGDHFLDLVSLGTAGAPPLRSGGEVSRTQASVNFDEVFDYLDARGRRRVRSIVTTIADGIAARDADERISGTVAGATRSVRELDRLTSALAGQERPLAELVASASTLLQETGRREQAIRDIVADGRATVGAVAGETAALDRALVTLPRVMRQAAGTLAGLRPVLVEARPTVARLRAVAPDLRRAFGTGGPFTIAQLNRDVIAIIDGLQPLRRLAVPVLERLAQLNPKLLRVVRAAVPAVRNLVPALAFTGPRARDIGIFWAEAAAWFKRVDSTGRHTPVVALAFDPAEITDLPQKANCDPATQDRSPNQGYCNNAYPKPGDSADPQPYEGPYTRLLPCTPPPRSAPKKECK